MRTSVDVDDELIDQAMRATGLPTKQATIEAALKNVVTRQAQRKALDELWGIGWVGDLEEMRLGGADSDDTKRSSSIARSG